MGNNVNVKEVSERNYINVKVRHDVEKHQSSSSAVPRDFKVRRAQRIADDLVSRFGENSRSCYAYFCKCAYNLSESTIWMCYDGSLKPSVKNRLAYFLAATKAQPEMR